ncbi:branched-chain amino acid transport system II carrier protein [Shigella flexneri]
MRPRDCSADVYQPAFWYSRFIKASAFSDILPSWAQRLPLAEQGLAWLMPTVVMVGSGHYLGSAAGRQVTSSAH